jgi:hypothetical protein
MPRFHRVDGTDIPFAPEEEIARNAEESAFEDARPASFMASLRDKRNTLLDSSDWTHYTDSPLDDEVKADWATYRQELRDLPATTEDPANPTWPEAPE